MSEVSNIADARQKKEQGQEQQVYRCDKGIPGDQKCECQAFVLRDEEKIMCAGCLQSSLFEWYVPWIVLTILEGRTPRPKQSLTFEGMTIHVCAACSGVKFHLYESGTIHCCRCKKQANAMFVNPMEAFTRS